METKMVRWTAGVTRLDRVRNDAIRQRFGVAPIAEKLREACLRWYGHVLRANEDTILKIGQNLEVLGKRPRGRPKQRWLDTLPLDLKLVCTLIKHLIGRTGVTISEELDPAAKRDRR
ncbi:unnamed protein product [Heligmosomoides polygyrus]|uniref:HTH_48 domain-containing protein n=1 Tax=Heligmosomoides polygyrus TaxID=6339 RepID=A0A183GG43_HELPZ|nr:unnamed protein product [Heligmosomoides polygyrus]